MRNLASIQEIAAINPIDGADKIEVATILGWEVVVKKGEFKVGDKCIYIEIDSILPKKDVFSFMEDRKYRVKTIKLRKQISQGIVFPLSILSEFTSKPFNADKAKIGTDVTDVIGVIKYDPEAAEEEKNANSNKKPHILEKINPFHSKMMRYEWYRNFIRGKKVSGSFPSFISKTDETRIQNNPRFLSNKSAMYITEKIDGQSGTFAVKKSGRSVEKYMCSRNIRLNHIKDMTSNHAIVNSRYGILEKLEKYLKVNNVELAIQGEVYGGKIQGNKYEVSDLRFMVFNIYDITAKKRLSHSDMIITLGILNEYGRGHDGLVSVPLLEANFTLPDTVNELVEMSKGFSKLNSKTIREGIVIRSMNDTALSVKVINPDFLLKHGL